MSPEHAALGRLARAAALLAFSALVPVAAVQAYYGDIVFPRRPGLAGEYPRAVFPHYVHRMQFKCYVCHDAIFKMSHELNGITMDRIQSGQDCGKCHNGTIAFQATFETCPRCHLQ
ncbi:MAG: c(7)-type cytochrome triheme domain-containing protein [Betaproteobacteria bacterium]